MKNIGNIVKRHGVRPVISLLYVLPVMLLLAGIVLVAVSMFKAPDTERTYYYIGMGILLVLVIILLAARSKAIPKHYFELYEKGLKIIHQKEKIADEEYRFDEITEIWHFSMTGSRSANYLAFLPGGGSYKIISPKFSDYKGLIKDLVDLYLKELEPVKSMALTKGERLGFPMLPTGGESVVLSEKAIVPYLQKVKKEHLSVDRFSVFDGKQTYALADIDFAKIDTSDGNIVVHSIAGNPLYTKNYFAVCNGDLFVALVNDVAVHKAENPSTVTSL